MYKKQALILVIALFFCTGCPDAMVGAPCVSETDNGVFEPDITGTTWSIETRSVQCSTGMCLTQTRVNKLVPALIRDECQNNPTVENCWGDSGAVLLKYSFCSCRCRDTNGNTYADNPDKYDDLCECPGNLKCQDVLEPIDVSTDKISGGYCIPGCIDEPCPEASQVCTPSKDSEEPWKWYCSGLPPAV